MNKYLLESILLATALTTLIFLPVIGFVSAEYFDTNSASNNGWLDGVQVSVTGWYVSPSGPYWQTSHTAQRWTIYPVTTYGLMHSIFYGQGFSSEAYTSGNRVWSQASYQTHSAYSYASSGFLDQSNGNVWFREVLTGISR